jgi:hypothetical protein
MIIEFDRHHACAYGVTEAAVIATMREWFNEARAKGENVREGRVWLTMTADDISSRTGFLTAQQARAALGSLLFQGVIITAPALRPNPARAITFAFANEDRFMRAAA